MKARLAVLFVMIVLLPLAALGWLGAVVSRDEEAAVRQNFHDLLSAKLKGIDDGIAQLLQERERELLKLTEAPALPAFPAEGAPFSIDAANALRALARKNPRVGQVFVLRPDGKLLFPSLKNDPTAAENEFVQRVWGMLSRKDLLYQSIPKHATGETAPEKQTSGWYVWHWENGLNLIFWHRFESGHIAGAELEPARWMADVIARLPNTADKTVAAGNVTLRDSNGAVAYQWGAYAPAAGEKPLASVNLSPPLNAWSLEHYLPSSAFESALKPGRNYGLSLALLAFGLALAGLAAYFYREYSRDVREAGQRVSFVNQVSHELKTPLTNIRMYAELLEEKLRGANADATAAPSIAHDGPVQRYLTVIVSESQRLSRLIANVLTFARQQKEAQALRLAAGSVDAIVGETLEQFRPALSAKGVKAAFRGGAAESALLDADILRQIVSNLVSNVEKYGAAGGILEAASTREGERVIVTVADRGPGIPRADRARIFQPFYRTSRQLSDGVTGTGIGLTIARELARLHGGDLTLERQDGAGACFKLVVKSPLIPQAPETEPPPTGAPARSTSATMEEIT